MNEEGSAGRAVSGSSHRVAQHHFTYEEWQAWLAGLSPRDIVLQMTFWQFMAVQVPSRAEQFFVCIEDARRHLRQREGSPALG